jgi:hypothetical protein
MKGIQNYFKSPLFCPVAMETAKNAKKIEKHKKNHSRLLAKQKLMKLDRNNIHS